LDTQRASHVERMGWPGMIVDAFISNSHYGPVTPGG
jgi:hypothetical protein